MQILHFTVTGQNIHTETQDVLVVEGSRRYVYAAFALDDAWDGLTVCALFENDSLHSDAVKKIITQEPVEVPPEVLVTGRLRIGLVGLADDGAVRLTTKRMFDAIPVYQSGGTGGEDAQTVTPELWEQSLSAIGSLGELETENKSNLVAAINEARRMGAGDSTGYTPVKGTDYFTDADKQEIAEAAAEMVSIPTQLPNPNALTFTGAVTGSYDGSAPLSVEIPSGGGGGGSSQWKIIRDLTITENADRVDINTDDDGKSFSLHEIQVFSYTMSYGDTAESFTFLMNGYWGASDPYFSSGFKSPKSSDNYYAYNHFIATMQNGIANVFQPWKQYIVNSQNGGDMFSIGDKYQAIESVSFVGKFIAGCRFVLVGRVSS